MNMEGGACQTPDGKARGRRSRAPLGLVILACALLQAPPASEAFWTCASFAPARASLLRQAASRSMPALTGLTMAAPAEFEGVYKFQHPGGTFDVHLRPGGRFFAPNFQARATWDITDDKHLRIDWAKFGKYDLALVSETPPALDGSAVGDPQNWRKMSLKSPFSAAHAKLLDSVWDFEHQGGTFPVEFRADGFNHFVCKDFPAHSHWSLTGNTVYINWGAYGQYELTLDESGDSMSGHLQGQPDNWCVQAGDIEHDTRYTLHRASSTRMGARSRGCSSKCTPVLAAFLLLS